MDHLNELRRRIRNHDYDVTDDGGILLPAMGVVAATTLELEHRRGGELIGRESAPNILPEQGRNFIIDVVLRTVSPPAGWYAALFSGNVTPADNLTAATFPAVCTEFTDYTASTRPAYTPAAAAAGSADNSADRAIFICNAAGTLYGGGLFTGSVKGSTNAGDRVLGVSRFAAGRAVQGDDELALRIGFGLTST